MKCVRAVSRIPFVTFVKNYFSAVATGGGKSSDEATNATLVDDKVGTDSDDQVINGHKLENRNYVELTNLQCRVMDNGESREYSPTTLLGKYQVASV